MDENYDTTIHLVNDKPLTSDDVKNKLRQNYNNDYQQQRDNQQQQQQQQQQTTPRNQNNLKEKLKINLNENSLLLNNNNKMFKNFKKYKNFYNNRNIYVDLLSIFFGIGSWISINSIYLQLPLLVNKLPEGWNLPSFLVVIIQFGNIGPIILTIIQKFLKNKYYDDIIIYLILIIGTISTILISFYYDITVYIFNSERSLTLFILVFFLSIVGCTSSVLFMPYMGRFRDIYLITYLIGEGLSGFIPSILTLIQGIGGNAECIPNNTTDTPEFIKYVPPPKFDTNIFFIIIFLLMIVSTISFVLLNKLKLCKNEYANVIIKNGNNYNYTTPSSSTTTPETLNKETDELEFEDQNDSNRKEINIVNKEPNEQHNNTKIVNKKNYILLMLLMCLVCMFGNGIFPSIQSYSCLPYGNISYHFTVAFSSIANPLACFLAVFISHKSIKNIIILTIVAGFVAVYTILTAVTSPSPPLVNTTIGEILIVSSWTLLVGLISYIKLSITTIFRYQGGKSLVWIGGISQMGSFIGAIVIFFIINYSQIFQSYEPC